jgi:anti-sigma B factor antagonist
MEFRSRQVGAVCILEAEGELEADIDLSWNVYEHIEQDQIHLILNLQGIRWLSSEGIGSIVASLKRARAKGGNMKLLKPTRQVSQILNMVGLDKVFEIFEDEAEAIASFGRG